MKAACGDPGGAYGPDGSVYAIILDTSPAATYIIKSTDGGGTWRAPTSVSTPDRPNVAVDPSNANIVYITFTDFNQPAGRIAGYKSTDGGVTWGSGPSSMVMATSARCTAVLGSRTRLAPRQVLRGHRLAAVNIS